MGLFGEAPGTQASIARKVTSGQNSCFPRRFLKIDSNLKPGSLSGFSYGIEVPLGSR